jgi:RimJ/RimL family protein N-acetyltransferase
MILETKRLILRPWREADAESLFRYASDPDIGPPTGWPPHESVENSREIIKNVLSAPETYAVCLKDGEAIGSVSLKLKGSTDMTDREDECELGYWIGKPFWGQGLIPEAARALLRHAFENLGMRAVWCGYYEGNEKSKRVQEKLGFVYQYTTVGLEVTLVNEIRTGHTNLMTRERWQEISRSSQ